MTGVWLFLAMPWVCLQFGIVVFPYRITVLFLNINERECIISLFTCSNDQGTSCEHTIARVLNYKVSVPY